MSKPRLLLRVKDLDASVAFYRDQLDWTVEWREPAVAQLRRPDGRGAVLTSDPDLDAEPYMDAIFSAPAPGKTLYIAGSSLQAYQEKLAARGVSGMTLQVQGVFGQKLTVPDPNGYFVGFSEEFPLTDDQVLDLYTRGPDLLEDALNGLTEQDLDLVRAPGKWSIRQTVLHLVDSDLTMLHRVKFALAEPGRPYNVNPYAQDNWAAGTDYAHRPVGTEVALFRLARQHVAGMVRHLPDAMGRSVVTDGKAILVRSMLKMLCWHIDGHLEQVRETRRRHGK